jgi:ketosteroid isomerase-like protein
MRQDSPTIVAFRLVCRIAGRQRGSPKPTRVFWRPRRQKQLLTGVGVALALFIGAAPAAGPNDPSAAKAAIIERLHRWTAAFNTRDLASVCGLFAPDLSYTFDDILNGSRDRLCANIATALSKPGLELRYDEPTIHEILVSGDLAVVRLTWTLTEEKNGTRDVNPEEGMDVFRRAPNGVWSIMRYIAFSARR